MEILKYTFYGFVIGLMLSIIPAFLMYRKKIVSGVLLSWVLMLLAGGGALIGLIVGLFVFGFEGIDLLVVINPANILKGNVYTIIFYVFIVLVIYYQVRFYNLRFPKRQFNKHQAQVIEGIWIKLEAKLPEIEEKKKADKPQSLKEMKNMIYNNFDAAIFFRELEKQPEIVDQYINDLCKYPLKEANLYFKYIIEEDMEALQEAAKLGHLQAIRTQYKLKK